MQMFADVTNRPIYICASTQAPALSSAMFAAVAAGAEQGGYDDIRDAVNAMANLLDKVYYPDAKNHIIYDKIYAEYKLLHDTFGIQNGVMKRLKALRLQGE